MIIRSEGSPISGTGRGIRYRRKRQSGRWNDEKQMAAVIVLPARVDSLSLWKTSIFGHKEGGHWGRGVTPPLPVREAIYEQIMEFVGMGK